MTGQETGAPREGRSARADITMISDWHRVGTCFSARWSFKNCRLGCEWIPHQPVTQRDLNAVDGKRYHKGRHQFLEKLAKRLGGAILVVKA